MLTRILALVGLACWCATAAAQVTKSDATPYFPLKIGNKWAYKAGDQAVLIHVDKIDNLDITRRFDKMGKPEVGTVAAFRLEISSGAAQDLLRPDPDKTGKSFRQLTEHVLVVSNPDAKSEDQGIFRVTGAGKDVVPPLRFFKLPPRDGDTWECNSTSDGMPVKGTFTCKQAKSVTVPAGTYQDVYESNGQLSIGTKKMDTTYWFAASVGIVKQHVKIGDYEVTLELKEFTPGK
jgi:hypothetical protein